MYTRINRNQKEKYKWVYSKFILHGTKIISFDNVNRFNEDCFCKESFIPALPLIGIAL